MLGSGWLLGVDGWAVDLDVLSSHNFSDLTRQLLRRALLGHSAYNVLEVLEVFLSQSIGLGNDGDEVDSGTESLHDLNIEWFDARSPSAQ